VLIASRKAKKGLLLASAVTFFTLVEQDDLAWPKMARTSPGPCLLYVRTIDSGRAMRLDRHLPPCSNTTKGAQHGDICA
jgi:hypothetical protein